MKLGRILPTAVAALVLGAAGSSYALVAPDGHHARSGSHHRAAAGQADELLRGSYAASYDRLSAGSHAITVKVKPRAVGVAQVGKTLTATPGTWKPKTVTVKYQWLVGGKAVQGATKAAFVPGAKAAGQKVSVVVVARKSGWTAGTATSPTRTVLPGKLTLAKAPVISGKATVGRRLVASAGTWAPKAARASYQWFRGKKSIAKATKPAYRVVAADRGSRLRVVVKVTKPGYRNAVASASTAKVG